MKKAFAVAIALMITGLSMMASPAVASKGKADNVTICHANNGVKGWVEITVDPDSIIKKSGHDSHDGDIIPAFSYEIKGVVGFYPGKNLDKADILANGCKVIVVPPTPTPSQSPTASPTHEPSNTPSPTHSPSPTHEPTSTVTPTPTNTPTVFPTPTVTVTPKAPVPSETTSLTPSPTKNVTLIPPVESERPQTHKTNAVLPNTGGPWVVIGILGVLLFVVGVAIILYNRVDK